MFTAGDGGNGHKIGNKRREKGATKDRVEKNIQGKKKKKAGEQPKHTAVGNPVLSFSASQSFEGLNTT